MGTPVPWKGNNVHATELGGGRFQVAPDDTTFAKGEAGTVHNVAVVCEGDELVLVDQDSQVVYARRQASGYDSASLDERRAHEKALLGDAGVGTVVRGLNQPEREP